MTSLEPLLLLEFFVNLGPDQEFLDCSVLQNAVVLISLTEAEIIASSHPTALCSICEHIWFPCGGTAVPP